MLSLLRQRYEKSVQYHKQIQDVYKHDHSDEALIRKCASAYAMYLTKIEYANVYHGPHFEELWNRYQSCQQRRNAFQRHYDTRRSFSIKTDLDGDVKKAESDLFII